MRGILQPPVPLAYGPPQDRAANYRSLTASLAIHTAAILGLLMVAPKTVLRSVGFVPRDRLLVMPLVAAPAPAAVQVARRQALEAPALGAQAKLFVAPAPERSRLRKAEIQAPPAVRASATPATPTILLEPAPLAPLPPSVQTKVFSEAPVAAPPGFSVPPRPHTGTFADAAKIALPKTVGGNPVASSGFDQAAAVGVSGSGGPVRTGAFVQPAVVVGVSAAGAHGRVGAAGFDQYPAGVERSAAAAAVTVHRTAFEQPAAASEPAPVQAARSVVRQIPVEILEKPRPVYTEEARRLKIEGTVMLDVIFRASGELRVLGVIHGLGHGLDQAAIEAAHRLRYKPAARNGASIDQRATLHVVFEMIP